MLKNKLYGIVGHDGGAAVVSISSSYSVDPSLIPADFQKKICLAM